MSYLPSCTDCFHYTNVVLFCPTHFSSVVSCTPFFFSWLAFAFLFYRFQRISQSLDYLFIWKTVITRSVLFPELPLYMTVIHFSYWWLIGWLPVPLLCTTDLQWIEPYLLFLTVFRPLSFLWNEVWIMLGHLEENKTQHSTATVSWPLIKRQEMTKW